MSENQPLPNSSNAQLISSSTETTEENWESVPLPGTVIANASPNAAQSKQVSPATPPSQAIGVEREQELLSLIHDLNQCNDVLLSRVTQLEGALQKSQSELAVYMANAQETSGRMAQQASASQASAQQQIARLVGEVDNTEQALSRQVLINENLQTEVDNHQERILQLEKECAIVAQQHLEETQARAKAESASRDLRSRLQRQQRYTMQFKAALEKSLTVTTRPSGTSTLQSATFQEPAAIEMPRAQRILPWVSDNSSPFSGIDPHLESLIRGVGKPKAQSNERPNANLFAQGSSNAEQVEKPVLVEPESNPNSEAEAKLWQDLERVMGHAESDIATEKIEDTTADSISDKPTQAAAAQAGVTEVNSEPMSASEEVESTAPETSDSPQDDHLIHQIERSFAATSHPVIEESVAFTEPSPWGKPLPGQQSDRGVDKKLEKLASGDKSARSNRMEASYLPAVDSNASETISPLVKPLRVSARKATPTPTSAGTLSNIELPTFQNAKVASFKR